MTDADLPKAYIKHQLAGRIRLKIPQKRGDAAYFERVAQACAQCSGITRLHANPAAASLLIQHDTVALAEVTAFAEQAGLFCVVAATQDYGAENVQAGAAVSIASLSSLSIASFDERLSRLTAGRVDLRSALFLGFTGLAIHQAAKGHFMSPASTFFWRALELLNKKNENMFTLDADTWAE